MSDAYEHGYDRAIDAAISRIRGARDLKHAEELVRQLGDASPTDPPCEESTDD